MNLSQWQECPTAQSRCDHVRGIIVAASGVLPSSSFSSRLVHQCAGGQKYTLGEKGTSIMSMQTMGVSPQRAMPRSGKGANFWSPASRLWFLTALVGASIPGAEVSMSGAPQAGSLLPLSRPPPVMMMGFAALQPEAGRAWLPFAECRHSLYCASRRACGFTGVQRKGCRVKLLSMDMDDGSGVSGMDMEIISDTEDGGGVGVGIAKTTSILEVGYMYADLRKGGDAFGPMAEPLGRMRETASTMGGDDYALRLREDGRVVMWRCTDTARARPRQALRSGIEVLRLLGEHRDVQSFNMVRMGPLSISLLQGFLHISSRSISMLFSPRPLALRPTTWMGQFPVLCQRARSSSTRHTSLPLTTLSSFFSLVSADAQHMRKGRACEGRGRPQVLIRRAVRHACVRPAANRGQLQHPDERGGEDPVVARLKGTREGTCRPRDDEGCWRETKHSHIHLDARRGLQVGFPSL
jgi:hypothetical protein